MSCGKVTKRPSTRSFPSVMLKHSCSPAIWLLNRAPSLSVKAARYARTVWPCLFTRQRAISCAPSADSRSFFIGSRSIRSPRREPIGGSAAAGAAMHNRLIAEASSNARNFINPPYSAGTYCPERRRIQAGTDRGAAGRGFVSALQLFEFIHFITDRCLDQLVVQGRDLLLVEAEGACFRLHFG